MKRILKTLPGVRSEEGVAMLELAIVAPFYLILLICTIDISRLLIHHMIFTEMAHEGVRLLSSIPYLESGSFRWEEDTGLYVCVSSGADCTNSRIAQIDDGLKNIVNGLYKFQLPNLSLRSGMTRITSEFDNSGDPDWVRVKVRARYDGFFRLFDNFQIRVDARGPYI